MARRIPGEAPVWSPPPQNDLTVLTLTLKTITPMFGGSAKPREVDTKHPIRAASIRGHLRFWWRTTAGATYTSADELFKAESELWGNTDKPGKIEIRVDLTTPGSEAKLRDYLPERVPPQTGPQAGYFVFPFNEDNQGNKIANGLLGVAFTLTLKLHKLDQEEEESIKRAIRSWLIFGGVGARTRRGLGALMVEDRKWLPKSPESMGDLAGGIIEITRLTGAKIVFGSSQSAIPAWRALGAFWAKFRKGQYIFREKSKWGSEWSDHQTLSTLPRQAVKVELAKPYLGLPLIYQDFPKDPKFRGKFHGILESEFTGRMSSPVILKPVAFADGSVRPMIVCLSAPRPDAIKVGSQLVSLSVPADDPVLDALDASDPLDAVIKAARIHFGAKNVIEVTL